MWEEIEGDGEKVLSIVQKNFPTFLNVLGGLFGGLCGSWEF